MAGRGPSKREIEGPVERVIVEGIPFKPVGLMSITNRRLIGKGLFRWRRFGSKGEILLRDLITVTYLPGIPVIGVPGLELEYRLPTGDIAKAKVHFASTFSMLGFKARTGYDAKSIYELILALSKESQESVTGSEHQAL